MTLDALRQTFVHYFCEQALGSTTSKTNMGETSHNLQGHLARLEYPKVFIRFVFSNVQDGKSLPSEKAAKMQTEGMSRN